MQTVSVNDRNITCEDCGEVFTFTEREQQFYAEREFSDPKRCRACRAKRKAKFNKNSRQERR